MSVTFSPDRTTATEVVESNGNIIHYKLYDGVYYHAETPHEVVVILASARRNRSRIRLHYGYTKSDEGKPLGRDWMEENDVEGYIGNSTGSLKIPIIVNNSRSMGGPAILDHCIVKITNTIGKKGYKYVQYQHPNYSRPVLTIREITKGEKVGKTDLRKAGYTHTVCYDGEMNANFKSLKAAERYLNKMS